MSALTIILDSVVKFEKAVQEIGVHRKLENLVVTLLVMKIFFSFLDASRACADFRDSTTESRIIYDLIIPQLLWNTQCSI